MWSNVDRAVRALRLRKGWTQAQLAERAGMSREAVSRLERGQLPGLTIAAIDQVVRALGASVQLTMRWQGAELDRLLDAAHATLQQATAAALSGLGWEVRVEVSFNHYGERGRIDLIAYHPRWRILLIVEIKSAIGNVQDTLGRLDMKVRLGRGIADELGWADVETVLPFLVIADSRGARRVVAEHDQLFGRFDVRGRAALAWLRDPRRSKATGLLWFAGRPDSRPLTNARARRAPKHADSRQA